MKKIKLNDNTSQYIRIFVLVAMITFFQYGTNYVFLKPINVSNLLIQNYYVFILAIGMFIVMITYNIDLSIGIVASFVSLLSGVLMIKNNMSVVPSVIICLLVGAFIGALQGFIIERFKIPSLVVTYIGSLILVRVYGGFEIKRLSQFPQSFQSIFTGFVPDFIGGKNHSLITVIIGIIITLMYIAFQISKRKEEIKHKYELKPKRVLLLNIVIYSIIINVFMYLLAQYKGVHYVFVLLVLIIFIYSIISVKTSVGKQLFTPGISKKIERLSNIKAKHFIFFAFINMGVLAALAGLISTARLNSCIPIIDSSILINAIAACYIGGASVSKGSGTISQVIIGVMIIGVFNNGMSLIGAPSFLQENIKLIILLIAVIFDVFHKPKNNSGLKFSNAQEHLEWKSDIE